MVNIVEVFSDTWFRALALDVCSGGSGGGETGGRRAAQTGQTSAAEGRPPEEQHDHTEA